MITYTYMVTNTGNVTLLGQITVTDDKVTRDCPPTATLAPGAVDHLHGVAHGRRRPTSTRARSTNIASASNGVVTSPPDTETVTAIADAAADGREVVDDDEPARRRRR